MKNEKKIEYVVKKQDQLFFFGEKMAFLSDYVKLIAFFHPPNRAAHSFIQKDKIQNRNKKYQIQSPRISQGLLYNFRRLLNQSRCESLKRDGRTEVFIAAPYNGATRQ